MMAARNRLMEKLAILSELPLCADVLSIILIFLHNIVRKKEELLVVLNCIRTSDFHSCIVELNYNPRKKLREYTNNCLAKSVKIFRDSPDSCILFYYVVDDFCANWITPLYFSNNYIARFLRICLKLRLKICSYLRNGDVADTGFTEDFYNRW